MDGDTENIWQDIKIRIDQETFCISCQISLMNKTDRTKNPLKPKEHLKWVFMDIITATPPKMLTSKTTFI